MGGWHTHWGPTTTLQLPLAMFHLHACAYLHFQPDHHIWTCPSVPAIPAPRAVWPTTGPKSPPSSWLMHPLSAHHHLPSPSSTLWMCMHMHIPNLAMLLHLDVSVHPCQPSLGGLFTTNWPQWPHYSYGWGTFYVSHSITAQPSRAESYMYPLDNGP